MINVNHNGQVRTQSEPEITVESAESVVALCYEQINNLCVRYRQLVIRTIERGRLFSLSTVVDGQLCQFDALKLTGERSTIIDHVEDLADRADSPELVHHLFS